MKMVKTTAFGCKVSTWDEYNIQHDKYNQYCCMLYMNVVKKANSKSSYYTEKFFSISLILYLHGILDVH